MKKLRAKITKDILCLDLQWVKFHSVQGESNQPWQVFQRNITPLE